MALWKICSLYAQNMAGDVVEDFTRLLSDGLYLHKNGSRQEKREGPLHFQPRH